MQTRELLRKEAKKIYKEKCKGVPKAKRISFADFYKQFKQIKAQQNSLLVNKNEEIEDINMEDFLNVNNLDDNEENT